MERQQPFHGSYLSDSEYRTRVTLDFFFEISKIIPLIHDRSATEQLRQLWLFIFFLGSLYDGQHNLALVVLPVLVFNSNAFDIRDTLPFEDYGHIRPRLVPDIYNMSHTLLALYLNVVAAVFVYSKLSSRYWLLFLGQVLAPSPLCFDFHNTAGGEFVHIGIILSAFAYSGTYSTQLGMAWGPEPLYIILMVVAFDEIFWICRWSSLNSRGSRRSSRSSFSRRSSRASRERSYDNTGYDDERVTQLQSYGRGFVKPDNDLPPALYRAVDDDYIPVAPRPTRETVNDYIDSLLRSSSSSPPTFPPRWQLRGRNTIPLPSSDPPAPPAAPATRRPKRQTRMTSTRAPKRATPATVSTRRKTTTTATITTHSNPPPPIIYPPVPTPPSDPSGPSLSSSSSSSSSQASDDDPDNLYRFALDFSEMIELIAGDLGHWLYTWFFNTLSAYIRLQATFCFFYFLFEFYKLYRHVTGQATPNPESLSVVRMIRYFNDFFGPLTDAWVAGYHNSVGKLILLPAGILDLVWLIACKWVRAMTGEEMVCERVLMPFFQGVAVAVEATAEEAVTAVPSTTAAGTEVAEVAAQLVKGLVENVTESTVGEVLEPVKGTVQSVVEAAVETLIETVMIVEMVTRATISGMVQT
ncbi:hypothetical protein B0J11DRAFT_589674 [Dendryphion nanum]|uniref:Uncharacterized protein n=1 Tax=Dendryphion nanum TaxID=256645 RepID=A0A9P9DL13_9PLEO|nr:hypothetical protein B0J11DRAFT_589674 [Dendryphion nanum]